MDSYWLLPSLKSFSLRKLQCPGGYRPDGLIPCKTLLICYVCCVVSFNLQMKKKNKNKNFYRNIATKFAAYKTILCNITNCLMQYVKDHVLQHQNYPLQHHKFDNGKHLKLDIRVQHKRRSCIVSNITNCLLQYHKIN